MNTRLWSAMAAGLICTSFASGCANDSGDIRDTSNHRERVPRHYACMHATSPIRVDGLLNEADWAKAPWSADFVDIEGNKKPTPRFRTRMKMLWDDKNLYVAAELEEPHVWATLTKHDEIVFHDNDFEIFIDPNGDRKEYYEIETNAFGTIFDLFLVRRYLDGGPALHDWNMRDLQVGIHVEGTLNNPADTDKGWTVEFALPWRSLAEAAGCDAPPKPGDTWRINYSRVEWHDEVVNGKYRVVPNTKEDNWVWSPQGVIDMHRPRHWGYVTFRNP